MSDYLKCRPIQFTCFKGVSGDHLHRGDHRVPHRGVDPAVPARDAQVAGPGDRQPVRGRRQSHSHHGPRALLREGRPQAHHLGYSSRVSIVNQSTAV